MTADELAFAKRMGFHIAEGLSFEDAARAVLDDDQRLAEAFLKLEIPQWWKTPIPLKMDFRIVGIAYEKGNENEK